MHYSKNSELKIALLLVNIIVYTECQQSQNSAVGLSFLCYYCCYSKTCPKRPLKKKAKLVFKIMQVESIAELAFIQLLFVMKIFVLSIFEWPLKTDFTVISCVRSYNASIKLVTTSIKYYFFNMVF